MTKVLNIHCQQLGICAKNGRRKMAEKIGYDYLDFIKNGIDADLLLELSGHDAQVIELVEYAKKHQDLVNG